MVCVSSVSPCFNFFGINLVGTYLTSVLRVGRVYVLVCVCVSMVLQCVCLCVDWNLAKSKPSLVSWDYCTI